MSEAQWLWQEIWNELQDPRSSEQILDGDACSCLFPTPCEDRHALMEKLHLLGIKIEYARRLCEGSIGNESHEKGDR